MTQSPAPWRWLTLLGAGAFALRFSLAVIWPTVLRPDEVFQNLEPAYRALTGWGVVSWEWRVGARSWLFPDALLQVMRGADALGLPIVATVAAVLSAISAATVVLGSWVGWRLSAWPGALLCGTSLALWPDLVFLGPKPLLEVQGGNIMMIAAELSALGVGVSKRRPAVIGAALGLSFVLRFQLAPGLLAIALATAGYRSLDRWRPLLLGASLPLVLLAVSDAVHWGSPFHSIVQNIESNVAGNRSASYGVEPLGWYVAFLVAHTWPVSMVVAVFFWLGIRMAPWLAGAACVVVLAHSLIAHKEISFVYAALPLTILVAGLGAARTIASRPDRLPMAVATCVGCSLAAGLLSHPYDEASPRPELRRLWAIVRSRPDLCGLALFSEGAFPWFQTPGYVGLERSVPIYLLQGAEQARAAARGFDYMIVQQPTDQPGRVIGCSGTLCLLHVDRRCVPNAPYEINTELQRLGQ